MENKKQLIKILIIEDDEDDYIIIKELLSEIDTKDFLITWANECDKAINMLKENDFDICLLDYRLGVHDGLEIFKEIIKFNKDLPVIFLTGQGEYRIDVLAMEAGASDYLVKDSLSSSNLERSIRYAIDRAKTGKALRDAHEKLEEKVRERTSELIQANIELKKASEKIQSFAYSISHDLKSPATALFALTRRLRDNFGEKLGDKGIAYCKQIMSASGQIIALVEKINMFIAEKEMPLNVEEINLEELLNEVKLEFSEEITKRKINWVDTGRLPVIRADRLSIIRALRNFLDNAFKHGGEKLTSICIKLEETTDTFIISVIDDGHGILRNRGEDVFLPFSRNGKKKSEEGSGLGLAIVKEISEKHGGEVWTGNVNGEGAVFCFSISKNI
ncbi:MAG: hybrid sensor histidine kinase/response regulator [Deltaproteobacteria bacterium]|nr:hybrid sensor histidine kinase/response regulator [Deltaproteobacteria bacterium]